jgi:hypothetical protein
MESKKIYSFDKNIIHPKIKMKKYDVLGKRSYRIYNYDNDFMCVNESEQVTQCRSVIFSEPEQQLLSFSLPQKSSFENVKQNMMQEPLFINEFIEGPMIHLFFDHRIQSWEIATKSAVGGHYPLDKFHVSPNKRANYINTLFCEMFGGSTLQHIPCFEYFSKQHCYNFIMQHPKQDNFIQSPRMYLIGVYGIFSDENCVEYIPPTIYMQWTCFQNTPVVFPQEYVHDVDLQLEDFCIRNRIYGVVIHNTESGNHYIHKSNSLKERHDSMYLDSSLFYQFLSLKQCNMDEYYLEWNPQHKKIFRKFQTYVHNVIASIYNHYVAFYISKTVKTLDEKYKYYVEELHHQYYLPSLAKKCKVSITKKKVYEYFAGLTPGQQLYACLYERRKTGV